MTLRRVALLTTVAMLAATSASAQVEDDLLVPLTPEKPKTKPPPKRPPTPAPKPGKKPTVQRTPEAEEGVPSVAQLLVKLSGGLKGAKLFVDDVEVGVLPGPAVPITPGEHTIVVRRPGYSEFTRRITVEPGRNAELVAVLNAVASVVAVTVNVPGATILIDGQPAGTAPLSGLLLKPGSHDFEARREGFEAEHKRIAMRAGRDYTVEFSLRPSATRPSSSATPPAVARTDRPATPRLTPAPAETPPESTVLKPDAPEPVQVDAERTPLVKRWYFWAGVGVVAAAVTTTVAVTQARQTERPLTLQDVCGTAGCDGSINAPTGAGIIRF